MVAPGPHLAIGQRSSAQVSLAGASTQAKVLEKVVPFSALPVTCSEVNNDAATSGVPRTLPRSCGGFSRYAMVNAMGF
jgi:hypothetical protein